MGKKNILVGLVVSLLFVACRQQEMSFPAGQVIDLTYSFDAQTIYWPTAEGFKLEVVFNGENEKGYHYEANTFSAAEHGGTHIDAPAHFSKGGYTTEAIPLERLLGPAVVVDVSKQCAANPDYRVQTKDFIDWETKNDMELNDVIILLRTGYGAYWPDRQKYMGTAETGPDAVPKLHFPGLHPDAATWLAENRTVKAIGLDTPSIDYGQSTLFESHVTLYSHNIPAFENVANLDKLPEKDFTVIALPMKIKGGSGGPLRIVAILK